ncbi:MAG: amidohydrolase family protein [Bacteroides sp.]|nr:amidohydrolase family protein [Bacteroides sp.]
MDTVLPIIDTHQHLWDLDLFPLRWVKPPLNRSFLTEDYLMAIEGQNVVKSIYMEVGVPSELRKKEAEWALELCKSPDNQTVAAVISADLKDRGFKSYMQTFEGNPYIKGIRYMFKDAEEMLLPQLIENIRFLGKIGLSFDLNLKHTMYTNAFRLLDECKDTRFILNHCGGADPVAFFSDQKQAPRAPRHERDEWYRAMDLIAQQDNIICKISGIVDNVPDYQLDSSDLAPIINHCIEVFGPDRVIFAGDWPVCLRNMTLARWIETVKEIMAGRSLTDQRKLFHDNASSFYGLDH